MKFCKRRRAPPELALASRAMRTTAAMRPSTLAALVLVGLLHAPRSGASPIEPPERLSVDDAVQIAIANHPTVTVNRASVAVTKARVQEAWAPWVPSLTGSFSYNPQTSNRALPPSFAGTSTSPPPANSGTLSNYFTANLGVSWSVFDFGKTWYSRQVALNNQVAAEAGVDSAERQVALDVRTAFYTALAAKALTDVSIESVATQQAHLDQVRGFVEVGTRTPVDVAKSQSDLAAAQLTLARARGNEEAARGTLHATLGFAIAASVRLQTRPDGELCAQIRR